MTFAGQQRSSLISENVLHHIKKIHTEICLKITIFYDSISIASGVSLIREAISTQPSFPLVLSSSITGRYLFPWDALQFLCDIILTPVCLSSRLHQIYLTKQEIIVLIFHRIKYMSYAQSKNKHAVQQRTRAALITTVCAVYVGKERNTSKHWNRMS